MTNAETLNSQNLTIGSAQISLLEKLSNACAVSGDEGEVRAIVIEEMKASPSDVKIDTLGNVIAICRSRAKDAPRVMLTAHMDEVGFMITSQDEGGLFGFDLVGGIDTRLLPGKPVLIGKKHIAGVIGAKPIHLTTAEERKNAIPLESLKIDIGPGGNETVKIGDRATFATAFQQTGPSLTGKALDDRLGVAILIELIRNAPENVELQAVFTVQEEVGARGARTATYALNPDLAIAVDSTPAQDLPSWDDTENNRYNTRLGFGPAIYVADSGTISDPRLVRYLTDTAVKNKIPFQFRQPGSGGTDASQIHKQREGIPSISVSVPGRYAHSPVMIARLDDFQNTLSLLHSALQQFSAEILQTPR